MKKYTIGFSFEYHHSLHLNLNVSAAAVSSFDDVIHERPIEINSLLRYVKLKISGPNKRSTCFHRVNGPYSREIAQLAHTIAHRVGRCLERQGWLERDAENSYQALDTADDNLQSVLQGH